MSAGSSARRAMAKAQGLFEPQWPPRTTVTIKARNRYTGRLKGLGRVWRLSRVKASPVAPEPVEAVQERRTLGALARGVFRGVVSRISRARSPKGQ